MKNILSAIIAVIGLVALVLMTGGHILVSACCLAAIIVLLAVGKAVCPTAYEEEEI